MQAACRTTVVLICLAIFIAEPLHAIRMAAPRTSLISQQESPDQRIMEEFVRTIRPSGAAPWNKTDVFNSPPVCSWGGIICAEHGRVAQIDWGGKGFKGTVDLTKLPSSLFELRLTGNGFEGRVDLTKLPASMTTLNLAGNNFSGSVDVTKLPAALEVLFLSGNSFSGGLDLSKLPSALDTLSVLQNKFIGPVDLVKLPRMMSALYLGDNQFDGSVDLTKLPGGLGTLMLQFNRFSGPVDLRHLPFAMNRTQPAALDLYGNANICGTTILPGWNTNGFVEMPGQCKEIGHSSSLTFECTPCH